MDFLQGKLTLVELHIYGLLLLFATIHISNRIPFKLPRTQEFAIEDNCLIDFKWLDETKLLKTRGPRELEQFQAKP